MDAHSAPTNIQRTISTKGKELLIYDGYKFRVLRQSSSIKVWRCSYKHCTAKIKMDKDENIVDTNLLHGHEKPKYLERDMLRNQMKQKVNEGATPTLLKSELRTLPHQNEFSELDMRAIRRAIHRRHRATKRQESERSEQAANQEVDGQLDGKSTSLSATKAKKLSKKVETQNPGADGGPSTSASVPQFPIPDFSASSTISDLNLSEPSTSADNSQSTPLEPSASVSGTGYTPSESPPIQVPELYESRMYISPTPMLFEEDMPASQDADGESGPTQTTSVADATPEPTESTSTVKVKPIETLQSKDMFGRESEQATENETAKVDISVKSLESAIKRLESVSNKLAATSNFDSYDQFGKYISSVLRGLPKKKVVSLKQKIITEVMQALSQEEGSGAKNTQTSKNRADTDSISKNCANNTPVITLPTVSQPTFGGPVMYAQLLPQVFEPQVPFSTNVANPSIVNVMTANTFKPPDIATIQPSPIISESLGGQTPFSTSQRSRGRPRKRSGPPETYTNKKMAPDDRTALTMASEMKTTSVNPDFTMAPEMNTTSVNSADELNMYQLSSGSQQESHSQDRLQESPQVGEMEGTTNVENLNSSQLEYEIDIEEGNELAKIKLDSNDSFETVLCEGSSGLYIKEEPPEPDSLTTSQAVTSPVNCHLCSERLMSREHLQEHFCSAHSGVNQSQGT
ncbi:mucin-2-like isoform X13 [Macrosteles quadrilineatus]|uniref:mucin-2-like isoform X13 n=1 Tax=Macrosteles quadrilineatus TaxID=74068 RepID=UPI0023E18F56|nr:mucin-2-like isoform X13 [Macrosteles quadrilineatus]